MEVIHHTAALRQRLRGEARVALVPTMGNLHAGHLALVEEARRHAPCVVVSIFVNPIQFGANEDFDKYPKTLEADCALLREAGAGVVFAPEVAEMYPEAQSYFVEPPELAADLCGRSRPGHFRGVATVVMKLFNMARPDVAVFGKKDYQQLAILRGMARQLNVPVEIVEGATVRADDGLALSSRNGYLSAAQRAEAPRLYRTLCALRDRILAGETDYGAATAQAAGELAAAGWRPDYIAVRDALTLGTPTPDSRRLVALAAAHLGMTRLIDNVDFDIA